MARSIFRKIVALFRGSKRGGSRPRSSQTPSLSPSTTSGDGSSKGGQGALVRLKSWFERTKKLAPPGFFSVEVGKDNGKDKIRHIIPIEYLYNEHLQKLLDASEKEFGHSYSGPLQLLCDEEELNKVLHNIRASFIGEGEKAHLVDAPGVYLE